MRLKDKLIKLGSKNPDLRTHLRPILDRISSSREVYNMAEDVMQHLHEEGIDATFPEKGLLKKRPDDYAIRIDDNSGDGLDLAEKFLKRQGFQRKKSKDGLTQFHTSDITATPFYGIAEPSFMVFSPYVPEEPDVLEDVESALRSFGRVINRSGDYLTIEPRNRQRLDHYGNGGEGWDEDGWWRDYAGPLLKKVKKALGPLKEKVWVDIGEKGHIDIQSKV